MRARAGGVKGAPIPRAMVWLCGDAPVDALRHGIRGVAVRGGTLATPRELRVWFREERGEGAHGQRRARQAERGWPPSGSS